MFKIESFYGNNTNLIADNISDIRTATRIARMNARTRFHGFRLVDTLHDMWGHDVILNYGNGSKDDHEVIGYTVTKQ